MCTKLSCISYRCTKLLVNAHAEKTLQQRMVLGRQASKRSSSSTPCYEHENVSQRIEEHQTFFFFFYCPTDVGNQVPYLHAKIAVLARVSLHRMNTKKTLMSIQAGNPVPSWSRHAKFACCWELLYLAGPQLVRPRFVCICVKSSVW